MDSRLAYFTAGEIGQWEVREIREIIGQGLPAAARLQIASAAPSSATNWSLRGIRSNERYTTTEEKVLLTERQEALGRPTSTCAVLIPIRKTEE